MPTAQTLMEPSHVLANLALLAMEPLVLVSKDFALYLFINISGLMLFMNSHCVLYTVRRKRMYC